MRTSIDINDVIIFDPEAYEPSRINRQKYINFLGFGEWRGKNVPFVQLIGFDDHHDPPLGFDEDVLGDELGGWLAATMTWMKIPCDPSNCMVVIERRGCYVKLKTLNGDYEPAGRIETVWMSRGLLERALTSQLVKIITS